MMARTGREKLAMGWREWVGLPQLGIGKIKAKIDTGARTSALHAVDLRYYHRGERLFVKFIVHPTQRSSLEEIHAHAPVVDMRIVRSSVGHETRRPVIVTNLQVGQQKWPIELTLVNRDVMGFRMLIGRQALRGHYLVDPGHSYLISKTDKTAVKKRRK